ncbi:COP9 signalosome complex subunit 5a [Apophysomyces sp. BC1015]|nr:COP9 signalosome complex subunit 5a [Apophysomyces sp. BC1015]
MDSDTARKNWEFENNIQTVDSTQDAIYYYDVAKNKESVAQQPWKTELSLNSPNYYKHVKISAIALIKMVRRAEGEDEEVMHARSGGNIEVMGLMQGKVQGDTMIIMDAFALPVEGTETRVNAQSEAYEYMVSYMEKATEVGRLENAIGWYHSHPGYGCWLSGIDVSTQMLNQQYQEPFVAVVIDPSRTMSAGKVEIGAFRTYPEGYKAPDEGPSEYQSIPLNKIEDFGVHAKSYYPLEVSHFKSTLDTHLLDVLWNKYWVNTLSQSPLLTNREYSVRQMADLAQKLEQTNDSMTSRMGGYYGDRKKNDESQLSKVTKDSSKITVEAMHGLLSQVLKDLVFNQAGKSCSGAH